MHHSIPRLLALLGACSLLFVVSPASAQALPAGIFLAGSRSVHRVSLPGTVAPALRSSHRLSRVDGARTLSVNVTLRVSDSAALDQFLASVYDPASPQYGHFLTTAQFARRFGPSVSSTAAVEGWLRDQGLTIQGRSANGLQITATGSAAQLSRTFGTPLYAFRRGSRTYVANTQAIQVPSTVAPAVLSVSGLSASIKQQPAPIPHATAQAQFSGYSPSDFRSIYDVSPLLSRGIDGSGQTVAIASFADFSETNVDTFDQQFNLPSPSVTRVSVSTGARLGARNGEDEAEMDIELVQAAAPGARILMYEAPNTDQGQVALFNRIVSDDQAKVVTTSWGGAEQLYPTSELNAIHQALQEGAAQGQAFFAASGDSGAYDQAGSQGGSNTALDVDYPASDPWVTGVGGTTLERNGTQYGTETAWSDESDPNGPSGSGGGLSTAFTRPSWQTGPGVSNSYSNGQRQVPDVAADSDPSTGYAVYTADPRGSSWAVVGGTSAASPVWGGFAALVNQATGHTVGFLNPTLYRLGQLASTFSRAPFHDVTQGDNLYYPATPGWDFATGWGTFDADAFVSDLATLPAIPTATPTATPAPTQTPVPRPTATKLASVQLTKVLLLHSVKGKQKTTSSLKVGEKGTLVVLYSVMNSSSKPQTATVQIKQGGKVIQTLTLKPTTYAGKPALAATVRYTSSSRVGSLHATATVRLGALASSLGYTFSVVKP